MYSCIGFVINVDVLIQDLLDGFVILSCSIEFELFWMVSFSLDVVSTKASTILVLVLTISYSIEFVNKIKIRSQFLEETLAEILS